METMRHVRSRMDFEQLKMPLGFIRILELIFASIVYTSLNGWEFDLNIACKYDKLNITRRNYTWTSFSLDTYEIERCNNTITSLHFSEGYEVGPNIFGNLAAMSLFLTAGAVLVYLFWWNNYVSDDRIPMIDLVIVVILGFGWLFGTFFFSTFASKIEEVTQKEEVGHLLKNVDYCAGAVSCSYSSYAMYQPLSVAMVAGMGCLLLYAANIWFCYKETASFRARNARNIQIQQEPYTLE